MKTVKWGIGIILASVLLAWGAISFINHNAAEYDATHDKNGNLVAQAKEVPGPPSTLSFAQVDESTPAIESEFPDNMNEEDLQQAIHEMSHQKVEADEKIGATPLTKDRVERLLKIVQAGNYEHESTYLYILKAWEKGDFSHAVQDHNSIWELQHGDIGKAYGLASEKEEKQWIEDNY